MNKLFTFLSLLFFSPFALYAQVQITDVEPEIGDEFTYENIQSEFDPGASGANAIWDFSVLGNPDYVADYTVSLSDGLAGASNFPESSVAWIVDLAGLTELYFFMGFENDLFVEYGSYNEYNGDETITVYTDPLVRLSAPLDYLNSSSDDYEGSISIPFLGDLPLTGSISYVVDAYGSITTPFGSYPEALRVNSIETEDQEFVPGLYMSTIYTTYMWYVENYPVPILIIEESESYVFGELDETTYSLTYMSSYNGVALGVDELNAKNSLTLYPNPSSDFITLDFDQRDISELRIMTLDGKNVKTQFIQSASKVDVSDLSPGYYIAELFVDGSPYSKAPFIINR